MSRADNRPSSLPRLCLTATGALLSLSLLAGCNAFTSPNYFPKGYVYHNDTYKSPTPSPSLKFTQEMRDTMTAQQAEQFRDSIYNLVQSLTARAGLPPKAVFVQKPQPMAPFYGHLDNDLRESLRHSGYTIADTPDNAYVFAYSAIVAKEARPEDTNVHLILHVYDSLGKEAKLLTREEGDYRIDGADELFLPFAVFPDLGIQPTGPARYRE